MRQISKIKGEKFKVILNEFEALGSPRTNLCEFLGISHSYLNKWLLNKFFPEERFEEIIFFIVTHRLTNEYPSKRSKKSEDSKYELKVKDEKKIVKILFDPSKTLDKDDDVVVSLQENRLDIKIQEGKVSLEQQELYKRIFQQLEVDESLDVEIVRAGPNSFRFITDNNDIESILIKINESTSYKLFLKRISDESR